MEEKEKKKLLYKSSLLDPLPVLIGVGISYLIKGDLDFKIIAPCVASGYLLIGAFFWMKGKVSNSNTEKG